MFMKNSGNSLQVARLVYIFTLMPALLLLSADSAAQSITNPRMRGMSSMQDHHSHPQSRQTVPRPATDELSGPTFTFTSIDVPGASNTLATGINARGAIVGIYYDSAGNEHGFLLKNGNFSTVDVPGSMVGVSGTLQTEANGINALGDIVGDYFAPPGAPGAPACTADTPPFSPQCRRGFLYHNGQFSDVLVPGKKGSVPNAISPNGTIYGCDHDDDYFTSMVGFGRIGLDTFITLDAGGGELKNPTESVVGSMNNGATPDGSIIVGLYVDPPDQSGQYHGYIVHAGTFQQYDVPGSTLTQTWGINPAADFVGLYDDTNGNEHGFLQRWGAAIPITIDVPSGPPFNATLTDAFAINRAGSIVGLYIDAAGSFHGYLALRQGREE
jgi:probable HAF family extracellular repeat protein